MPELDKLASDDVNQKLLELKAWNLDETGQKISREFLFKDFKQAWSFMNEVALNAEELKHHPDWSNSWNQVAISLSTHDAGGLTAIDFELARRIDSLGAKYNE